MIFCYETLVMWFENTFIKNILNKITIKRNVITGMLRFRKHEGGQQEKANSKPRESDIFVILHSILKLP